MKLSSSSSLLSSLRVSSSVAQAGLELSSQRANLSFCDLFASGIWSVPKRANSTGFQVCYFF